ncbi:GNAT family N-acetyltransferase [Enterococcus pallens]|uniref:Acetyltransferase n=1 Tax=Enterococcus pallens ATCC BAA-351 TaxID=1158607 RepID=R2SZA9_9ENTE|nr:GNAT family protein [Enterococcus pallens]EOH98101.1 acetyltransferase [Enterococcus pallens ATCC BAA-351]EOU14651.1 acetyltransferase [Enterococcus pallens ATCC BAA-351]
MSEALDVVIREAIPDDAEALLQLSQQVAQETEYLVMDETGMALSSEMLAIHLESLYESPNNLLLVVFVNDRLVGNASVKASTEYRVAHIGEIGISILQEFWGIGIGSMLMEEILFWAQEGQIIRRLELTVQAQNKRAIQLYQKFGFEREATMVRGARSDQGEFLDVHLMSLLID